MRPDRFAPLTQEQAAYLLAEVEAFEPHWVLMLPYVPDEARGAWLSVMALAVEVISAPARVSNAMLGQIRLQWWRDALGEVFGSEPVRRHPVAEALEVTLQHDADEVETHLYQMIDGVEVFLAPGDDSSIEKAIEARRPFYGSLAGLLGQLAETASGGDALLLHALLRSEPDRTSVPGEDGVEAPRQRFSRALAQTPSLAVDLAASIKTMQREVSGQGLALPALPLALVKGSSTTAGLIENPFFARASLFKAVLTGRL